MTWGSRVWKSLGLAATAAALLLGAGASPAAAAPCDAPITNPVACENTKPGNPASEWDVSGAGDASIQGFATEISVDQGQTISFKVDTSASAYHLDMYRMGYYGGSGARKVATVQPLAVLPQLQPSCLSNAASGLVDCGNWSVSATWSVPADAVSGIYFAKLVRDAGGAGSSHIPFVVRDDDGRRLRAHQLRGGDGPRRVGSRLSRQPHRDLQRHPARHPLPEEVERRQHHHHVLGGRAVRLPKPQPVRDHEAWTDRAHRDARHRARRRRSSRQRDRTRRRRRRSDPARPARPR